MQLSFHFEIEIESPFDEGCTRMVRIAIVGKQESFEEGQTLGEQIRENIEDVLKCHQPGGLIIDVRKLAYTGGDWIAWSCLSVCRLKSCRTCLVTEGTSGDRIRELWEVCRLNRIIQVFQSLREAGETVPKQTTDIPGN